jgi:hypothetical protein
MTNVATRPRPTLRAGFAGRKALDPAAATQLRAQNRRTLECIGTTLAASHRRHAQGHPLAIKQLPAP